MQQVKQPPPPLRLFVPDVPVALEKVILRTLEKNPTRRFQSAEALAQALTAAWAAKSTADAATQASHEVHPAPTAPVPLRIMLADDHTVLRKTLINLLSQRDEFIVVGEAGDGQTALDLALQIQPDVLLLDLNMPIKGGLDILPDIRRQAPNVKVLVLTGREEDWYIMRALRAGAHGYILKSSNESELMDGIIKVTQGHMVLGQGVAEKVVTGMLRLPNDPQKLTDSERQILLLIAGGFDNEQISERLGLPMPDFVEALARAMDKMKAKDRHAAALQALRNGDILLDELQTLTQMGS